MDKVFLVSSKPVFGFTTEWGSMEVNKPQCSLRGDHSPSLPASDNNQYIIHAADLHSGFCLPLSLNGILI